MSQYTLYCRNKVPLLRSPSPSYETIYVQCTQSLLRSPSPFYESYVRTVYTKRPPLYVSPVKIPSSFFMFVFHGAGNGKREGGEGLFQEILSLFPGSQGTYGLNHGLTAPLLFKFLMGQSHAKILFFTITIQEIS
jgi:hypothetical protein